MSIFLYAFDEITFGWIGFRKIQNIDCSISTKLSNTIINTKFGKIGQLADESEDSLVFLPANEFFARYMLRAPLSLEKLEYVAQSGTVIYCSKMHATLKRNFQVRPGGK